MLTCKGASQLISQNQDRSLSFFESWALRVHVWMCLNCRRFEHQIALMRRLLHQSAHRTEAEAACPLSTESRERISKALAE
jgi:hypothetical protein